MAEQAIRAPTRRTRDEYRADERLLGAAGGPLAVPARQAPSSPTIGKLIDDAMVAIERDNPTLKGVLPKDYARPALDKQRLGELIDLIGTIGLGDDEQPLARTSSAASTNTSSASSPAPRARRAASSTRRAASSAAGRDARAVQGPRLRPLLRLGRHVRAVARSSSRPTAGGSATSAIYGQESQPHDLAAGAR